MTRFARGKGSKASNERVPEQATSWGEMKQQMVAKNKEIQVNQKRNVANKQREANYKTFLKEVEDEKTKDVKWAEFEENNKKKPKVETSEPGKFVKVQKTTDAPKGVKRKRENDAKKSNKKQTKPEPKPKKDPSELTEEERQKVEKRKAKVAKQAEKRRLKKEMLAKQAETADSKPVNSNLKKRERPETKPDRRKQPQSSMIVNGKEIPIAYLDGFPIKKEDAERIQQLRKQMISKGLPRSEIKIALKLERRKAEKAFARERKKVCFNCRKSGHNLSECPELGQQQLTESMGTGICFKCGSTEHTHFECRVVKGEQFKFATCFICKEQGHISRQCPDNARGLYPKGGACKVCGDVTHMKKDCPKFQAQQLQLQESVSLGVMDGGNPDSFEEVRSTGAVKRQNKIVKF